MSTSVDSIFTTTTIVKRFDKGVSRGGASGFFYRNSEGVLFLITNKHVIYGEGYVQSGAIPEIDEMRLVLHEDASNLQKNREVSIRLFNEGKRIWKEHQNPEVDIVGVPATLGEGLFLQAFDANFVNHAGLQIAFEKLFVMGYPLGWYDSVFNLPITRIGHLSSPFGVPFRGQPFMLGDVETHPGMSGSPVLMELHNYTTVDPKDGQRRTHLAASKRLLVGVFSGQPKWEIKERETGEIKQVPHSLSVIWFASLIGEIVG